MVVSLVLRDHLAPRGWCRRCRSVEALCSIVNLDEFQWNFWNEGGRDQIFMRVAQINFATVDNANSIQAESSVNPLSPGSCSQPHFARMSGRFDRSSRYWIEGTVDGVLIIAAIGST